jgi:hypothetical protein
MARIKQLHLAGHKVLRYTGISMDLIRVYERNELIAQMQCNSTDSDETVEFALRKIFSNTIDNLCKELPSVYSNDTQLTFRL